jgi:hypothetical protein
MTPQEEEALWRSRFITLNLTRIGGTLVVLFGLLVWQSDAIVPEGSIVGLPIALAGLVASFAGPKWLIGKWRTPPNP